MSSVSRRGFWYVREEIVRLPKPRTCGVTRIPWDVA